MAGIDITGDTTSWIDNITIYSLDSTVIGNDTSTPDTDGDSNIPLRQLANRTARIKELLDTFGIYVKDSEFTHSGQNVIYNAPIRGDVVDGNVVAFNLNQYWNLDLSQTDSRNIFIGFADVTNSRIITSGLLQITDLDTLGLSVGDPIYADPDSPGEISATYNDIQVGYYLFDDVMFITREVLPSILLEKLKTVDGHTSGLDADTVDGYHASELNGVSLVTNGTRTASGSWTLTDLIISKPLIVVMNGSATNQNVRYKVTSGAVGGYSPDTSHLFSLAINTSNDGSGSHSFTCIPTSDTVTIYVVFSSEGSTLYAYQ